MRKKLQVRRLLQGVLFSLALIISCSSFAQGVLDPAFGNGGIVTTNFGFGETTEAANKVLLQPDGKIILAGGGSSYSKLARYNPDGTLDISFGTEGKVSKQFSLDNIREEITDIVLLPDGAIVAAGYGTTNDFRDYFFVTKFLANGSPDNSFTTIINRLHEDESGSYSSVGLRSDGKIIWIRMGAFFLGSSDDGATSGTEIVRLLSDGTGDGFLFDQSIRARDILILPNNDFLLCGSSDFALAKYSADLVKQGGLAHAGFPNLGQDATGMILQADGKILLAGQVRSGVVDYDFGVVRYTSDGALDNSFGTNGKVVTDLGGTLDGAFDIIIQPDGKIIVVGKKEVIDDTTFAAVRYLPTGELDPCFGNGGKLLIVLPRSWARSVVLQPDGKIVLAGLSNTDFAAARFVPSTEAPPTWYLDADGDGYGDDNTAQTTCTQPPAQVVKIDPACIDNPTIPFMCPTKTILWVTVGGDCDDNIATINPGAAEVCDGFDNNCNGQVDEGLTTTTYYPDADGDGYGSVPGQEFCSNPGAGWVLQAGDCNDSNASIHPEPAGGKELCDGVDNDCDGVIDEGCSGKPTLSISDVTVYESEGIARLTISLSHITTLQVKVNYKTSDGTAMSTKKDKDYKAIGNTALTIPPGTLNTTITVQIYNDGIVENNEYFYVVLSKAVNGILGTPTGMVTILDGGEARITARSSEKAPAQASLEVESFDVRAFPNPSRDNFKLKITTADQNERVLLNVYDVSGRLIETKASISPNAIMQFGDKYRAGVYMIQVIQGKQHKELRLVKIN